MNELPLGDDRAAHEPASPPTVMPKVDPATLVLRGSPRRVVRFRRELIIGLAAACSIGLAASAWLALKPTSFRLAATGEDSFEGTRERPPEILAGAPGSYGDIPKLGPPLPGDLGRPILERQRELARDPVAPAPGIADAAAAAREQALAQQAAARQSAVLMGLGSGKSGSAASSDTGSRALAAGSDTAPAEKAGEDPVVSDPASGRGRDGTADVNPHRIAAPASPWILSSGSVIAANLVTGINSDLPGSVIAQVSENAYDSITGRTLLIPQGARLIGGYESAIAFGQRRAFIVWKRIVWPDGSSLRIDDVPASDAAGFAGLADSVDVHGAALLRGVALSTLLGVGTQLGLGSDESDLVKAVRESVQQNGARAGDRLVGKSLDIEPTITVRPGWPVRVVVQGDLVLRPWRPRT